MVELKELFPADELDKLNFKDKKQKAIELALQKEHSQKDIAEHFGFDYKSFNRWVNQSNNKSNKKKENKAAFKPADSPDADELDFVIDLNKDYPVDDSIKYLKANLYKFAKEAMPSNIKALCDSAKVLSELEKTRGTGIKRDEELLIKLFSFDDELDESIEYALDASESSEIELNEYVEGD